MIYPHSFASVSIAFGTPENVGHSRYALKNMLSELKCGNFQLYRWYKHIINLIINWWSTKKDVYSEQCNPLFLYITSLDFCLYTGCLYSFLPLRTTFECVTCSTAGSIYFILTFHLLHRSHLVFDGISRFILFFSIGCIFNWRFSSMCNLCNSTLLIFQVVYNLDRGFVLLFPVLARHVLAFYCLRRSVPELNPHRHVSRYNPLTMVRLVSQLLEFVPLRH